MCACIQKWTSPTLSCSPAEPIIEKTIFLTRYLNWFNYKFIEVRKVEVRKKETNKLLIRGKGGGRDRHCTWLASMSSIHPLIPFNFFSTCRCVVRGGVAGCGLEAWRHSGLQRSRRTPTKACLDLQQEASASRQVTLIQTIGIISSIRSICDNAHTSIVLENNGVENNCLYILFFNYPIVL